MNRRIAAATAALAVVALAPAGAVVADQMLADHVTVSGAAPSVTIPTSPSTGSSGTGGSSGDNSGGSGSSSGNGSAPDGNGQSPWRQATSARTSGTPVSSWPGVVMIDTVVQGGEGAGSGIVLTSDGVVLTNYHVVDGSTAIRVKVANGSTYTAKVLGFDQTHDVALIKLEGASGLQTASLDTGKALLGEKVTAVGQGGGRGTLYKTSGRITDTNQQITASDGGTGASAETLHGLLETNAQIVPGYSGGPLLNSGGQVVGMDTAASSGTPVTGYAIPTSAALKIAGQIESGTKTSTVHIGSRAALGVEISTRSAAAYGYGGSATGASVVGVASGGAAASAGITAGSTITAIDGKPVAGPTALTGVLDTKYPGDKVSVSWVDAQGQPHTATVTLGTSPQN
ncbi:S1C family serine protease [Flexivirga sp.]|uniref:S1C family serine protease n=1 Tax=Flexivirga sp. TaxID=1962927 RepID=UPI003F80F837